MNEIGTIKYYKEYKVLYKILSYDSKELYTVEIISQDKSLPQFNKIEEFDIYDIKQDKFLGMNEKIAKILFGN